jgi:hypothetical protein
MPNNFGPQANHPIVSQACCHQQPGQALRLAEMTVTQVKAPALLVRKEGLDVEKKVSMLKRFLYQ